MDPDEHPNEPQEPREPQEPQEPTLPSAEQVRLPTQPGGFLQKLTLVSKMRARRLAKLGQAGSSSSSDKRGDTGAVTSTSSTAETTSETIPPVTPSFPSQQAASVGAASKPNPVETSRTKAIGKAPEGRVRNTKKRLASEIDPDSAGAAPELPAQKLQKPRVESIEEWTHQFLSSAFRITADPLQTRDKQGHELLLLPVLSQELVDRGQALRLSLEDLDPAILEMGNLFSHKKPLLDYFLPCWKNIIRAGKQLRDQQPKKVAVLQEAKRLCMSNSIFALTMPEYFG